MSSHHLLACRKDVHLGTGPCSMLISRVETTSSWMATSFLREVEYPSPQSSFLVFVQLGNLAPLLTGFSSMDLAHPRVPDAPCIIWTLRPHASYSTTSTHDPDPQYLPILKHQLCSNYPPDPCLSFLIPSPDRSAVLQPFAHQGFKICLWSIPQALTCSSDPPVPLIHS